MSVSAFTSSAIDAPVTIKHDIIKLLSYIETFTGLITGIFLTLTIQKRVNYYDPDRTSKK
jgi:hypothetical protein